MVERYKVVDGSQSAHCCFDATVVDMTQPVMIGGKHYAGQFGALCECFDRADAERIAAALNAAAGVTVADQIPRAAEWLEREHAAASKEWQAGWDALRVRIEQGALGVRVPHEGQQ